MRASSGRVRRGRSRSSRDTPEWRLPREGAKEQGKGVRARGRGRGKGGGGRWCRLSAPTCSTPKRATQSVQSQAPASVRSEDEGPPDGQTRSPPWIRLLWRLHLIPLRRLTRINSHCRVEVDGGPKEERWRETEKGEGAGGGPSEGHRKEPMEENEWECESDVNKKDNVAKSRAAWQTVIKYLDDGSERDGVMVTPGQKEERSSK